MLASMNTGKFRHQITHWNQSSIWTCRFVTLQNNRANREQYHTTIPIQTSLKLQNTAPKRA